jgi:hypothetical protein
MTALHVACDFSHTGVEQQLLNRGRDFRPREHRAILAPNNDRVNGEREDKALQLDQRGGGVVTLADNAETQEARANALQEREEIIKMLLNKDPAAIDAKASTAFAVGSFIAKGVTCMHLAACHNRPSMIRLLAEAGGRTDVY